MLVYVLIKNRRQTVEHQPGRRGFGAAATVATAATLGFAVSLLLPSSGFCGVAAAALSLRIWSWLEVVAPKSWLGHAWWVRARKCVASASSPPLKRHSELESTANARRSTSTGVMAGRWEA